MTAFKKLICRKSLCCIVYNLRALRTLFQIGADASAARRHIVKKLTEAKRPHGKPTLSSFFHDQLQCVEPPPSPKSLFVLLQAPFHQIIWCAWLLLLPPYRKPQLSWLVPWLQHFAPRPDSYIPRQGIYSCSDV